MNRTASGQWQSILEEEEALWRRGHPCFDTSDHHDMQISLLDQCPNIARIHGYFSNLELRKCCLKLAGANTTFSSMRVVGSSSRSSFNSQPGSGIWASKQTENGQLTDWDFPVYQSTLMCAGFPVLSVPDPPADTTPTFGAESVVDRNTHSTHSGSGVTGRRVYSSRQRAHLSPVYSPPDTTQGRANTTPAELFDSFRYKVQHPPLEALHSRSNSQTSGIDSLCSLSSAGIGDEDEEAMAVLPPESLCEWVRRMFGLNQDAARLYEKKIYQPHRKKTFAKILVEELCKQLSMLESDSHPFYNSKMFMSREAYTRWQHYERARIGHMIQKFWHHSLPTVKGSSHLEVALYQEHYRHLLKKIVTFEGHVRGSLSGGGCEMSSASRRILREFSCRHGIGEFYQKIVFLELLSDNFSSNIPYTQKVICQLLEVRQLLPQQMAKSVLVATEYEIMSNTLTSLQAHCKHVLTRIKRIYEEDQILTGVGHMIQLLALLVELRAQLDVDNSPTVEQLLRVYTKENLHGSYERHKVIARGDLEKDPRSEDITPKLINRLLLNIKDEVCDYKRNYAPAFQRYLDVVQFAGIVLYDLLMEDVTSLCVTSNQKGGSTGSISLPLLGLVYRLDQLDRDSAWQQLISPVQQTWRREFFSLVLKWEKKLEEHGEKLLLQCVGSDRFATLRAVFIPAMDDNIFPASRCTSTQSHASIAVSEFSAFSAFRNHCSPSSTEERLSPTDPQGSTASGLHKRDVMCDFEDITEDILTFQSGDRAKASRILRGEGASSNGLLPTHLVPNRCASAPIKFVSFDCGLRSEDTEDGEESLVLDRDQRRVIGSSGNHGDKRDSSGQSQHVLKDRNRRMSPVQNHTDMGSTSMTFVDVTDVTEGGQSKGRIEEADKGKQWQPKESRPRTGGSTGDLSSQLVFTGTRKLRSQSLREDTRRPKARSNSALGSFSIPKINSHPMLMSMPRPRGPVLDTDVGNALLDTEELLENGKPVSVSSSAVEVVMVLKRISHTVKTLCDTLYPNQNVPSGVENFEESELYVHVKQNIIMRWKLYTTLHEIISEMVTLYTYNMLSMDFCGESNLRAKQILGQQVLDELKRLYRDKCVWGCRHMVSKQSCKAFSHTNKVTYLADKYEPVSREMCTRVNNLVEVSHILDDLFSTVTQSLCLHHTLESAKCCHLVLEDESFLICERIKEQVREGWLSLVHLMVYRLTLFVKEAMNMLQQLEVTPTVSMETLYHPVIRFLKNYTIALNDWLNQEVYEVLVKNLWEKLVNLFEDIVTALIDQEQMLRITAERLLQFIAHLMKLLCDKHGELDLDFAESRAEKCLDMLSLCTAPTIRLILIYRILRLELEVSDVESDPGDSPSLPPKSYLQCMYKELHQARKCFTGSQLVNWIMLHPPEHYTEEGVKRQESQTAASGCGEVRPSGGGSQKTERAQWSYTGFDLARAQNMAKLLLKKGVIYQLDKTSMRSSVVPETDTVYPDLVHYGTSSLGKLRSYSFNHQGLSQSHTQHGCDTGPETSPDFRKKRPMLKRITSAPQFSLGGASHIDVSVLKSELEFRQFQTQFASDSDSCTEGQLLTLNEKTRRRIERLMQCPTDSSGEDVDENKGLECMASGGSDVKSMHENTGVCTTTENNSSHITTEIQSDLLQEHTKLSSALQHKTKDYGDEVLTIVDDLKKPIQENDYVHLERNNHNACNLVVNVEIHSPYCGEVSEPEPGKQDISETSDKGTNALAEDNAVVSGSVQLTSNTPNVKVMDIEGTGSVSSSSTVKYSEVPADIVLEVQTSPLSCDHHESVSGRHSPRGGAEDSSDSSVLMGHWHNSTISGEYGLTSSAESYSSKNAFHNTNQQFYAFSDGTEHLADCLEHIISFLDHMGPAEAQSFQHQLSSDIDHFQKEHPCFGYQFSTQHLEPKFILQILKCRKHHDYVAKHFLRLLPRDQKLEYDIPIESIRSGCFKFF